MNTKEVKFIDVAWNELFRVPNNSMVVVEQDGKCTIQRVQYIDSSHLSMGGCTYHNHELAEKCQQLCMNIQPEEASNEEAAAWQFGFSEVKYLYLQSCDDGWDYSIYDETLELLDGGQIDDEEMTIEEARNAILEDILDGAPNNVMIKIEKFDIMLEYRAAQHFVNGSAHELIQDMKMDPDDCFGIFQLPATHPMIFKDLDILKYDHTIPKFEEFNGIYMEKLSEVKANSQVKTLENIYFKFNIHIPDDYRGRSLSVGDVVVLKRNGSWSAHMVGNFKFNKMKEFLCSL